MQVDEESEWKKLETCCCVDYLNRKFAPSVQSTTDPSPILTVPPHRLQFACLGAIAARYQIEVSRIAFNIDLLCFPIVMLGETVNFVGPTTPIVA